MAVTSEKPTKETVVEMIQTLERRYENLSTRASRHLEDFRELADEASKVEFTARTLRKALDLEHFDVSS